jgi:hypothetical protein
MSIKSSSVLVLQVVFGDTMVDDAKNYNAIPCLATSVKIAQPDGHLVVLC